MKRNEVAKLMDKIPKGLSPDEFLVALATHAAAWGSEQCAVLCETECAQNDGITCAEEIRARSKI